MELLGFELHVKQSNSYKSMFEKLTKTLYSRFLPLLSLLSRS